MHDNSTGTFLICSIRFGYVVDTWSSLSRSPDSFWAAGVMHQHTLSCWRDQCHRGGLGLWGCFGQIDWVIMIHMSGSRVLYIQCMIKRWSLVFTLIISDVNNGLDILPESLWDQGPYGNQLVSKALFAFTKILNSLYLIALKCSMAAFT